MKTVSITILKLQALGLHPYQYALRATPMTPEGRCWSCDEWADGAGGDVCTNPECEHGHGKCALCERVQPMHALHASPEALPQDLFCETCLGHAAETPAA